MLSFLVIIILKTVDAAHSNCKYYSYVNDKKLRLKAQMAGVCALQVRVQVCMLVLHGLPNTVGRNSTY